MFSEDKADLFVRALKQSERAHNPAAVVALFAEDAIIETPASDHHPVPGKKGVAQFFRAYLDSFDHVESTLRNVHEFGDIAILEWQSQGLLTSGRAVDYQGVSIVEFDALKIKRFTTYYAPTDHVG